MSSNSQNVLSFFLSSSDGLIHNCNTLSRQFLHKTTAFSSLCAWAQTACRPPREGPQSWPELYAEGVTYTPCSLWVTSIFILHSSQQQNVFI